MNLPNKITLARIMLIPIMVAVFYIDAIPYAPLWAAGIFAIASFTDFLDGYIARSRGLVTNMGKFLDPIADKVLVVVALFLLVDIEAVPAPFGAIGSSIIVARELIVSGFRQIAAANNVVIAADKSGKIKTCLQIAAILLLMVRAAFLGSEAVWFSVLSYIGYAVGCLAVLMTLYSGINYIVKNKQVLKS
ncbi:MAG: CDP-diacylglycerol--glycerol-3-phosphate 3-phosphatidyltransferase [Clostridia bacterium]|nr:CDP-diacylglycerol--glycerol-3-phosphate 3-phosphatidyltransferase [Clostridia bacterium]